MPSDFCELLVGFIADLNLTTPFLLRMHEMWMDDRSSHLSLCHPHEMNSHQRNETWKSLFYYIWSVSFQIVLFCSSHWNTLHGCALRECQCCVHWSRKHAVWMLWAQWSPHFKWSGHFMVVHWSKKNVCWMLPAQWNPHFKWCTHFKWNTHFKWSTHFISKYPFQMKYPLHL